jgi:phosphatidate cytidylyltransferase
MVEMARYEKPGGVTVNIAAAVFAVVYVGLMLGFIVQLRMVWGIGALASLLIVVKFGDTGAFAVGRLFGRHKMAPKLSPGKTIEGALGGVLFSCASSWAVFYWLIPALSSASPQVGTWWRCVLFALLVCFAGMAGDLAESLIKRDAQRKDSSTWMPGLGGILDILDSTLLAGPVAYACWATGLVG